jgi:hypothetical protein
VHQQSSQADFAAALDTAAHTFPLLISLHMANTQWMQRTRSFFDRMAANGAADGLAAMAIDPKDTPLGDPAGDGTAPARPVGAAAGEHDAFLDWLQKHAADAASMQPIVAETDADVKQMLFAATEAAAFWQQECIAARQRTRRAYEAFKSIGMTPRNVHGPLTNDQLLLLRDYIRAAAAERDAVTQRESTQVADLTLQVNALSSNLTGERQQTHNLLDLLLTVQTQHSELQPRLSVLETAKDEAEKECAAATEAKATAERENAELQACVKELKSKQVSDVQKRLLAAMGKPVTYEGKIGSGADRGTQSGTGLHPML